MSTLRLLVLCDVISVVAEFMVVWQSVADVNTTTPCVVRRHQCGDRVHGCVAIGC
jgi:hypothetical protein